MSKLNGREKACAVLFVGLLLSASSLMFKDNLQAFNHLCQFFAGVLILSAAGFYCSTVIRQL